MVQENYEKFYKNYWEKEFEEREKSEYYKKRYDAYKKRLMPPKNAKIIDVGGGNGHFLHYLGIKKAKVTDISDSGLKFAEKLGYETAKVDLHKRFQLPDESFDVAYCFEVLEHLNYPNKTLAEMNNILRKDGILFVGQPNTPADGKHHVRRIYLKELVSDLEKSGFKVEWTELMPAFNRWEHSFGDIIKQRSIFGLMAHTAAFMLSLIPLRIRKILAKISPNRFALMYILKCRKIS